MMGRLAALIWLRHRLWWNGLRSNVRAADTVVAVVLAVIGVVVSAALAAALALVLHLGLAHGDVDSQRIALLIVFWAAAFVAVGLPVILGSSQQGLPLERLLCYPLSRGRLYRISLGGSSVSGVHLFWYPALLVPTVIAVMVDGFSAVPWIAVSLVFSVCLVVWCHTILLVVQRVLRRRRLKELIVLIGLAGVVTASFVPAFIDSRGGEGGSASLLIPEPVSSILVRAASVLPPSIAADGLSSFASGGVRAILAAVGWLLVWTAAGVASGSFLLERMLVGGGIKPHSPAASSNPAWKSRGFSFDGWTWLPAPCRAVAARDLHYLFRSTVGKFNIVMLPVFVVMVGLLAGAKMNRPVFGIDPASLVFVGVMAYASMFSNNFLYNAYAWEGTGVRSYFISPVTPRQVVFGKNLGLWMYNLILAAECVVAFSAIIGLPDLAALITGCLAFAAVLLGSTVAGNFVSAALPVARDISKIGNSPSQTGILVSFAMLLANVVLIGGLLAIAALAGLSWLQPVLLALLFAIHVVVYGMSLRPAAALLERRKEALIEASRVPS